MKSGMKSGAQFLYSHFQMFIEKGPFNLYRAFKWKRKNCTLYLTLFLSSKLLRSPTEVTSLASKPSSKGGQRETLTLISDMKKLRSEEVRMVLSLGVKFSDSCL